LKTDKNIDAQLVEAYQSGNKEALASLVKRWHLTFCKKAFWLVKDADLSKDIAQETWQTIISKIDTLKDASSFGSWALRIVYSKSLDTLRNKSIEHEKLNLYRNEQVVLETVHNENKSLKSKLLIAINKLPKQQQQTIKLFYVEEYSLKEISKVLNISIGTAKSRLFHAREKLKKSLKNNNF
jgi:RNA polymerase sigma-70 factor (ECF subfamily)